MGPIGRSRAGHGTITVFSLTGTSWTQNNITGLLQNLHGLSFGNDASGPAYYTLIYNQVERLPGAGGAWTVQDTLNAYDILDDMRALGNILVTSAVNQGMLLDTVSSTDNRVYFSVNGGQTWMRTQGYLTAAVTARSWQ